MEETIEFHFVDIEHTLLHPDEIRSWINAIARRHGHTIHHLSIIFCSDDELLRLNKEFLNHDYFTDILTFPYHKEGQKEVVGDLHISIDRIKDNAIQEDVNFIDEFHRVIIHGVLHLVGFDDTNDRLKEAMRREENIALSLRMF